METIIKGYKPYSESVNMINGKTIYMSKEKEEDVLIIVGGDLDFEGDASEENGIKYLKAPLTHNNACKLREYFPFTAPKPVLSNSRTFGVGDRLGVACPGHLRVFKKYDAIPILAQQSIRELNLTGRTYEDVLDVVTFAVYREGFKRGFGADGDHLKTAEELEYAIQCGYTMITLDCSEHIRNDINAMSNDQVDREYHKDEALESLYIGKSFDIGEGVAISFEETEFKRTVLIYIKAIEFACGMYKKYIKDNNVDYEISIDETATPTTPLQHFFVANELKRRGVEFKTMAPRFCGDFQKGVDYIGDLEQFEKEFSVHATIARHFGYKISVHSGSDKFSVYPVIGRYTRGVFHVKTAGTNWLEAMKLVAIKDAKLYREIHTYAIDVFEQAKKYYHVTTQLDRIPNIDSLDDLELQQLFSHNDCRQLIHITYGLILNAKNPDGSSRFRDRLYKLWNEHAEAYAQLLEQHIGKHLELLYAEEQ